MELAGLQHDFLARLRHGGLPPAGMLTGDGRGFAIYRASYLAHLGEALRDLYPVVDRLVGRACFTGLARAYVREQPSAHADLHCYGGVFADFLGGAEALAGLPYLPDVARLEWRVHEVFHAADAPVLTPGRLARVPRARQANLRLRLHPGARLMVSVYPVQRIWQVNQPDWTGGATVDLDTGGAALAICRDGLEIVLLTLEPAAFALARAFQAGHTLAQAIDALLAVAPGADPAQALHLLLQQGLLLDFTD